MAIMTIWWKMMAAQMVMAAANKADKPIGMPDLGRRFWLGELYDATTDQVVGGGLWPLDILSNPNFVKEVPAESSNYKFAYTDSTRDKHTLFDLDGELSFSMTNSITVEVSGGARFLADHARSSRNVRTSVMYQLRTVKKSLNVYDPVFRGKVTHIPEADRATHVVTSIIYGGNLVATFEKKASDSKEVSEMSGFLQATIKLAIAEISARIELNMSSGERVISKDTSLYMFGDILPGVNDDGSVTSVPLDPDQVVDFFARAQIKTVETGGVPCWVTLTPINWVIDGPTRLVHELSNAIISESADIGAEFDEGMTILNDLSDEDNRGFLAWSWEVEAFRTAFKAFEIDYKTNLSAALISYRKGEKDISAISDVIQNFRHSQYTVALVRKFYQNQMDSLISLREMVSSVETEGGVKMATVFSDYMAMTFSSKYDAVITLVLAGMNPATDRESMVALRRFFAFAKRTRMGTADEHCLMSVGNRSAGLACTDVYKLVMIHFDSFCNQFCDPEYCGAQIRTCSNASASSKLDPTHDKKEWCQNPCSRVVLHAKQGPAERADSLLPDILGRPTVAEFDQGDVEVLEPHNQQVKLTVQAPKGDVEILNWRVRITHYEFDDTDNKWIRYERIEETRSPGTSVTVMGLTAGESYTFEVAGVNSADAGPYSVVYPSPTGVRIARPLLKIESITPTAETSGEMSSACGSSWIENKTDVQATFSAPNWMPWPVTMAVSVLGPSGQHPSVVEICLHEQVMHCAEFEQDITDKRKFECTIPCTGAKETQTYDVKVLDASQRTMLAESTVHHVPPSSDSCRIYQVGSVFCNVNLASQNWGCVETGNSTADKCKFCKDDGKDTYYSSRMCSSNKCGEGEKLCPSSSESGRCIAGDCTSSCDSESEEASSAIGQICALPCNFRAEPESFTELSHKKLRPGQIGTIRCSDGYVAKEGSSSPATYDCASDNLNAEEEPVSSLTCKECTAGSYVLGATCSTCTGSTRRRRAETCTECVIGKYSVSSKDDCSICAGSTRRRRADTCSGCASGTRPGSGSDDCEECASGMHSVSGDCSTCYGSTRRRRADACTSCASGRHYVSGSDDCEVNACTCTNGIGVTGAACTSHGAEKCKDYHAVSVSGVDQTSQTGSWHVGKSVDGLCSTYWQSRIYAITGQWVTYDVGSSYSIGGLMLYEVGNDQAVKDFNLYSCNDYSNWEFRGAFSASRKGKEYSCGSGQQEYFYFSPMRHRYWSLDPTSNQGSSKYVTIRELTFLTQDD
eukprot:TRINITY_DN13529_c0_g1_i1.p1 TRINITY_DN13529_c0_g1~~TRINITY_DN13529_c0_g1_i1.p1  ORF type:complete len:1257 (-),score=118.27 TRINITY_DN13529_c0_g1_i1:62-3832(-)